MAHFLHSMTPAAVLLHTLVIFWAFHFHCVNLVSHQRYRRGQARNHSGKNSRLKFVDASWLSIQTLPGTPPPHHVRLSLYFREEHQNVSSQLPCIGVPTLAQSILGASFEREKQGSPNSVALTRAHHAITAPAFISVEFDLRQSLKTACD
jgi:hypothetical protein